MPAKLDFKWIAESIDIAQVVAHIGLSLNKEHRTACPCCESDRTLQIFPDTNTFRCHHAQLSGDCITMYGHALGYQGQYRAAKELNDLFLGGASAPASTSPTKPEGRPAKSQPPSTKFDPDAFASKLIYSDEVAALGVSEADAERLGIGWHVRYKMVFLPIRNTDGSLSAFVGIKDAAALKMPPQFLGTNVVPLRRPA